MSEKIILSILIPTYNRADYLMKNLNILLNQLDDELKEIVEVRISDNCSQDSTVEKLKILKEKNPIINFSINEKNLGADRNFFKLVKEAKGKYIWLFGDDEFLLEDGLKKIVNYLKKWEDVGLFHIIKSKRKKILFHEDKVEFMKNVNHKISFITANIFNSEKLEEYLEYEKFYDSCLIQELFYFQAIEKFKKNAVIKDRIFSTDRADNIGGYKLFEVFAINQNKILEFFENRGLNKKIRKNINKLMCIEFFPQYIVHFRLNRDNNKWLDEDIEKTLDSVMGSYKEYRLVCKPLLKMPIRISLIYIRIIKKIKKIYKLIY